MPSVAFYYIGTWTKQAADRYRERVKPRRIMNAEALQ